jgi:hypothetical protein
MVLEMPDEVAWAIESQLAGWLKEPEILLRDAKVKRYLALQEKIDRADALFAEAFGPPMSNRSVPFVPYDAFEFARDLSGKEVSPLGLAKLAYGRFPDMSSESRQPMMHDLIDHGHAKVSRKNEPGRPKRYRFAPPRDGGMGDRSRALGTPRNELSGLKSDDLAEVAFPER